MNKSVLYVIIIGLVAAGVWFFSRQDSSPQPVDVQRPEGAEVTVTYTDSGYSPAEIRVKPGTKVVFKNQSRDLMWTASGPHPAHTALPGFDALSGAAVGQSYAYTFLKPGTWRYHNHLRPNHVGTVIVE